MRPVLYVAHTIAIAYVIFVYFHSSHPFGNEALGENAFQTRVLFKQMCARFQRVLNLCCGASFVD